MTENALSNGALVHSKLKVYGEVKPCVSDIDIIFLTGPLLAFLQIIL